MSVVYKLADVIAGKPDGNRWAFVDGPLSESFAGIRDDGEIVISWRGENFVRQRPSLRVWLHNWLIAMGNRRQQP